MGRLQDSPPLTRFVIERNKVTTTKVKPKLFEPYQGKVSVFQTENWPKESIEKCGVTVARERDKEKLYGWAILRTGDIPESLHSDSLPLGSTCTLTVDVDNVPLGHANITGWPSDPDDVLDWQEVLADTSTLCLCSPPIKVT